MKAITASEFDRYYTVQMSGITNMYAIGHVVELTGLTPEQVLDIMRNYSKYAEEFGYK